MYVNPIEMPVNNTRKRDLLFSKDPYCHWCGELTAQPKSGDQKGPAPPNLATLDHIYSQRAKGPGKPRNKVVLACYRCNSNRNNAEQKGREITKGGMVYLPDGRVESKG